MHFRLGDDFTPIFEDCDCYTCTNYTSGYLHHLNNTKELLLPSLLMMYGPFILSFSNTDSDTISVSIRGCSHYSASSCRKKRNCDKVIILDFFHMSVVNCFFCICWLITMYNLKNYFLVYPSVIKYFRFALILPTL